MKPGNVLRAAQNLALRSPRLFAAMWFGVASLIILITVMVLFRDFESDRIVATLIFIGPSVPAAAIVGALCGHRILDGILTPSGRIAVNHGIGVSLLAFGLYTPTPMIITAIEGGGVFESIGTGMILGLQGLVIAGIPIMLVGGVAGWLLYLLRWHTEDAADSAS